MNHYQFIYSKCFFDKWSIIIFIPVGFNAISGDALQSKLLELLSHATTSTRLLNQQLKAQERSDIIFSELVSTAEKLRILVSDQKTQIKQLREKLRLDELKTIKDVACNTSNDFHKSEETILVMADLRVISQWVCFSATKMNLFNVVYCFCFILLFFNSCFEQSFGLYRRNCKKN